MGNLNGKDLKFSFISRVSFSLFFLVVFLIKFGIIFPSTTEKQTGVSLPVSAPYQLTFEEENVSWYSDNPFVPICSTGELTVSEVKRPTNGQIKFFPLANKSEFTATPWAALELQISINRISSILAFFGFEIQYPMIGRLVLFLLIFFVIGFLSLLVILLMKFGILIPLRKEKYRHVSLSVGVPFQLTCERKNVSWHSDSTSILLSPSGEVLASEDKSFPNGQGKIYALSSESKSPVCIYTFTIVPWIANESKIAIGKITSMINIFELKIQHPTVRLKTQYILPSIVVHGNVDGWIYYSINRKFYKTQDNFQSSEKVTTLPFRPGKQRMIVTPFGFFMRGKEGVYYSDNLKTWGLSFKTNHPAWLLHNMDFWYDRENQKAYIYVVEYSMIIGAIHNLYKGTVDGSKKPAWETAVAVISESKLKQDPRVFLKAARHIHLVKTDPYSGDVWFGTGDENSQSILKRSTDNGKTFQMIGMGSQEYRTLGIWFTKDYIYWNMDTGSPDQKIFRVSRDHIENIGPLTPILKTGKTKIGVDYIVASENFDNYFPVKQAEKFTETIERPLSEERHVVAVTDPDYDKKELVANLSNGSHWSVFDVKTPDGETVTLVSTTSEGFHRNKTRDNLGRVFGLQENKSGSVTVRELLTVAPFEPKKERARLEGIAQADDGTIFFQSFHSIYGGSVVTGSLIWNNGQKTETTNTLI